jgi:hypothetical protein
MMVLNTLRHLQIPQVFKCILTSKISMASQALTALLISRWQATWYINGCNRHVSLEPGEQCAIGSRVNPAER